VRVNFTGQRRDAATGLGFYNARYYDSEIGRFISADSIVPGGTQADLFNRYAYVRNNPLKYVDPTGNHHKETCYSYHFDEGPDSVALTRCTTIVHSIDPIVIDISDPVTSSNSSPTSIDAQSGGGIWGPIETTAGFLFEELGKSTHDGVMSQTSYTEVGGVTTIAVKFEAGYAGAAGGIGALVASDNHGNYATYIWSSAEFGGGLLPASGSITGGSVSADSVFDLEGSATTASGSFLFLTAGGSSNSIEYGLTTQLIGGSYGTTRLTFVSALSSDRYSIHQTEDN